VTSSPAGAASSTGTASSTGAASSAGACVGSALGAHALNINPATMKMLISVSIILRFISFSPFCLLNHDLKFSVPTVIYSFTS
jgi:hypothetical protein